METNGENQSFKFTYSAKQQQEIKNIRKKYISSEKKETDKMEQLRRLDASVTQKATSLSLVLGVIGALVLGFGMSLVMTDLGASLGLGELSFAIGIPVGIVGMAAVCLAYPLYNHTVKKERKRISPEILRLTDELLK